MSILGRAMRIGAFGKRSGSGAGRSSRTGPAPPAPPTTPRRRIPPAFGSVSIKSRRESQEELPPKELGELYERSRYSRGVNHVGGFETSGADVGPMAALTEGLRTVLLARPSSNLKGMPTDTGCIGSRHHGAAPRLFRPACSRPKNCRQWPCWPKHRSSRVAALARSVRSLRVRGRCGASPRIGRWMGAGQ